MRKGPNFRDAEVGRRVRALRLQRGLTQEALAVRLGLTFQQIQKYEKGSNRIGAGRLSHIAEILEVPTSVFFDAPIKEASKPLLELGDTAGALRLFQAYDRITSPRLQRALIAFAEVLADTAVSSAKVYHTHETDLPKATAIAPTERVS